MKRVFIAVLIFSGLLVGCYKEEAIHGREGGEPFYTLPQGNHAYDEDIVAWFEKYGFYTLYDFSEKDLYWNGKEWEEHDTPGYTGNLSGYKADTNYVAQQLDLFYNLFLKNYQDNFLAEGMPLKVLLCSHLKMGRKEIHWGDAGDYWYETVYDDLWAKKGYDYLAINGGSELADGMNDSLCAEFSTEINSIFLRILGEKKILQDPPATFFEVSSEWYGKIFVGGKTLFQYGFLTRVTTAVTVEEFKYQDFLDYLNLVGYPLRILEGDVGTSNNENLYPSLRGIFNSNIDVNGLVRKKYDIIVAWLRTKGINVDKLQYPQNW